MSKQKLRDQLRCPTRALAVYSGGAIIGTATWMLRDQQWTCCSSSPKIQWIRGIPTEYGLKTKLQELGLTAKWIVPNYVKNPTKPPFEL